jgi:hypothetical protein
VAGGPATVVHGDAVLHRVHFVCAVIDLVTSIPFLKRQRTRTLSS